MGYPKVFDLVGNERDWNWVKERYGSVIYYDAGNRKKFELVEVRETTGHPEWLVSVFNEAGGAQYSQPVINRWPNDSLPKVHEECVSRWYPRGSVRNTDGRGVVDFGYGRDSMIKDLAIGGPHTLWVGSLTLPSDGLGGLGWRGGTHYECLGHLVFKITGPEDGEDDDGDDENGEDEIPEAPNLSIRELLVMLWVTLWRKLLDLFHLRREG